MSIRILAPSVLSLILVAACDSSSAGPDEEPVRSFTVAAADTVRLDLAGDTVLIAAPGSTSWDIGFYRTAGFVNTGAGVLLSCLCQNSSATTEQVRSMTPDSERTDFDVVGSAQIPPAGAAWSGTVFTEKPWYRYNITGQDNQIWPMYEVYLLKRGDEVYKIQITGYYNAAGDPRHITFRYVRLAS